MFGSDGYITQVILEDCDECVDEKNERLKQKREVKMEVKIKKLKANRAGWLVSPMLFFCKHLSLVVNKYLRPNNYEIGHKNIVLELKVNNWSLF